MGAVLDYLYLPLIAFQVADKKIDITNGTTAGGHWYANPLWIAVGVIGVIVVLLLVVLAARGGGTTIVKD
jgi:formate-dependent nitrite reductase membrane component NrfD